MICRTYQPGGSDLGDNAGSNLSGNQQRRFWCDEAKLEIIMSVGVGGAAVTQVAQRHEVTRQQICAWRHDFKKTGLWSPDAGSLFFPMDMPVAVELRLRGGRSLHSESTIGPAALSGLIRAVETA